MYIGKTVVRTGHGFLPWKTFHRIVVRYSGNLPALTICALYKSRWQVELFFKFKQHLRIKRFYGTSENARKVANLNRRARLRTGRHHQEALQRHVD